MVKGNIIKQFLLLALILFALSIPVFVHSPYYLHVCIIIALHMTCALGLWLVVRTGQLSIGHAAFMAVGAYTSALLTLKVGLPFWAAFFMSGITSVIIAIIIGIPTLRIKGAYFAILTFGFGELVRLVLSAMVKPFGGVNGITGIRDPDPIKIPLLPSVVISSPGSYYIFSLILAFVTLFVVYRLNRSHYGMNFKAIAEADLLAECLGINIMRYKLLAFTTGAFFVGLAGSVFAHYYHYIAPDFFTFADSVKFLVYVAVGGIGSIAGPIIGAVVFVTLPELLSELKLYIPMIYGAILVVVILLLPGGIVDLYKKFSLALLKLKRNKGG